MTTPPVPPPPGNYPPPEGSSPEPRPGAYEPSAGGYEPTSGGYPPPPPPGGYPPPSPGYPPPPPSGAYPPPTSGYPPPPPAGGYPPPPPAGGYPPPPPAGGYPPQAGGYQAPPPPGWGYPEAGYYPQPGAGGPALSIGEGWSWAWNKFAKNAGPLVVATLVFGLIVMVLGFLANMLGQAISPTSVTTYDAGDGYFGATLSGGGVVASLLSSFVHLVVSSAIGCAYFAGLLDIADGRPVTVGSFFRPRNVGSVIIASLIVGLVATIGLFLCVLPGLAVILFAWFTTVAIVDRNLAPVDGIKTSIDLVKRNFGPVFLFWLVSAAITVVGALLCGVGLLVAAPVAYLLHVYAYRKLSGQPVAPVTV